MPTNHPIKGQAIYAFVTMMEGYCTYPPENPKLKDELVAAVRKAIGAIATPDVIHWVGVGGQGGGRGRGRGGQEWRQGQWDQWPRPLVEGFEALRASQQCKGKAVLRIQWHFWRSLSLPYLPRFKAYPLSKMIQ